MKVNNAGTGAIFRRTKHQVITTRTQQLSIDQAGTLSTYFELGYYQSSDPTPEQDCSTTRSCMVDVRNVYSALRVRDSPPEWKLMSYIQKSLSDNEKVLSIFKLHWTQRVLPLLILLALTIATVGLLSPVLLYVWLALRKFEQGLTNKRVIKKKGIISRNTQEMTLKAVETLEIRQGVFDRLFGLGTVKVTGQGVSDIELYRVSNPMRVKRQIESALPQ